MSQASRGPRTIKPLLLTVAILAVVATGCYSSRSETGDPCMCPNLEAVAASIDWLGDGTPPSDSDTTYQGSEDPLVLAARVSYADVGHGPAAQAAIAQRMIDAGFVLTDQSDGQWRIAGDEWIVTVSRHSSTSGSDATHPWIWIRIVDDDDRAAEILAPVTNALGTIP